MRGKDVVYADGTVSWFVTVGSCVDAVSMLCAVLMVMMSNAGKPKKKVVTEQPCSMRKLYHSLIISYLV